MNYPGLNDLIIRALQEDIGHQDITTSNLISPGLKATGIFYAKSSGILAGVEICQAVFNLLDPDIIFTGFINDGQKLMPGNRIAMVQGEASALLTGERTALNFMQRLSGIASKTYNMVQIIKPYKAQLVDTRKTTPGLRFLEKYAVKTGGGRNHRLGLFDGVMIKDNHILAAGGIIPAINKLRPLIPLTVKIEVEVENLDQLRQALQAGADIIMLDNMDVDTMRQAVLITDGQALLEASGGINEETIAAAAQTGVDFISSGALTHSAVSLDISFDITEVLN
ncbi:MAG TPA: carboxylating nicotinate-nucleotide diphosphorylase [Syntrophomonadaceae bacterium]|nr:carboxylating nicotinate-nucleotide diphosphorylase [Syntrophomonadaceae bacterium]HNX28834.1 carboxylating nicotinate-nucleotide diphosphorylase [Syntrophomonadaceae bacterium]HPR93298.1 carboxylating nicotinate-nucleotide diphosphorylase [Syntrophomonadaceae bacterium]